jgi:hypothetical protein
MARGKFKARREVSADGEGVDGEYYEEEDEYYDEDGAEEDEYEEDVDAEYEGDDDTEAEYDGGEEAEYDDESEDGYEEDDEDYEDEEYEQDEYEGNEEPYRSPNAWAALKDSFTGKSRPKARPASGTEEDAQRVNYVTSRERALGFFLGFSLVVLGILVYVSDKHATRATLKYPATGKLTTAQQANLNTIHAAAPKDLIVYAALGILILVATFSKRRAAIAFTTLFAGLALFFTGDILGILYLGVGGWMIFKVRKQTKAIGSRPAGRSRTTASRATSPRARSSPTSTTSASTSSEPRQIGKNNRQYSGGGSSAPTASKRYTPPKPVRRPAPSVQPEPEPSNRLTAWLRK